MDRALLEETISSLVSTLPGDVWVDVRSTPENNQSCELFRLDSFISHLRNSGLKDISIENIYTRIMKYKELVLNCDTGEQAAIVATDIKVIEGVVEGVGLSWRNLFEIDKFSLENIFEVDRDFKMTLSNGSEIHGVCYYINGILVAMNIEV